ncbi:hypothetical protein CesoFtcFv8_026622 [Champsocephalus esox]|uniref:Uncharacterized protein n=1 Tax=Champsocephalus esox TaxID=159716 RepID=A0AAN8AZQ6_9TELE|nr:hypothetical protein CesoFtcFv8_026622 [Champsocephalus esox]
MTSSLRRLYHAIVCGSFQRFDIKYKATAATTSAPDIEVRLIPFHFKHSESHPENLTGKSEGRVGVRKVALKGRRDDGGGHSRNHTSDLHIVKLG